MRTLLPPLLSLFFFITACSTKSDQIFNGKNLSQWEFVLEDSSVPSDKVFSVINNMIHIKGEPLGYMYTKKQYQNYNLELEYRWEGEATNSGVFLIIEEPKSPFPKGIECQLMYQNAGDFVLLGGSDMEEYQLPDGVTERPQFPVVEKNSSSSEKPVGEWNKVDISVYEGVIDVFINGVHQNTGTSVAKIGHIGLQSEGGEIYFRNIVLNEIDI